MRLKDRVKNLVAAIKGQTVPSYDYKTLEEAHKLQLELKDKQVSQAFASVELLIKERDTTLEDNKNLHNDNVQLTADNVELLAKNQTLTKHCTDLVSRVETMKKDMNTQIQFMGLINTAVNQLVDGIKGLPERMESIEKGYLNPLPTEDKPE